MVIYDFGCIGQPYLGNILLALSGAVAALAVVAGLAVIGAFLRRGARFQAQDIFVGWGVVAAVMTLTAVLFNHALPFATFALFLLIAVAAIPALKSSYFNAPFWLLTLFPGLFILAAINLAGVARWDDFSHWVPNALYLFQYDSLPGPSLPAPHSLWPGYPYALPFLTYMASWLAHGFLMQGGAMINFLLLMAFASILAELPPRPAEAHPLNLAVIGRIALAVLLVTLANPGFDAKFIVTSHGDAPTMVLTAALGLMLWRITQDRKHLSIATILPIALTASALVLIKQSNIVLLGLLVCAFMAVSAKNKTLKPTLAALPMMIAPALILRFIWQQYVDANIGGNGFAFHPLSAWRFDLAGPLLRSISRVALTNNGLSALMLIVTGCGIANLFRRPTPLRNFALMTGVVYLGYILFLIAAYLGATFTEAEIIGAASFYRYSTHTILLGVSAFWMAAPTLWQNLKNVAPSCTGLMLAGTRAPGIRIVSCLLAVAVLPLILFVHGGWLIPPARPTICATRLLGRNVAEALPSNTNLAILEPEDDGMQGYFTHIVNLELGLEEARTNRILKLAGYMIKSPEKTHQYLNLINADKDINAILVHQALHNPLQIDNYDNGMGPLLLYRSAEGWNRLALQKE